MHVFLTGEVQCGKSTAIARVIKMINRPVYGFRTIFTDRCNESKVLYMVPGSYDEQPRGEHIVTQFECGRPKVLTERFNEIGEALLKEAQAHPEGLILMDECSRFEREALRFHEEIFRCLDGDIPVLGVVRLGAEGWVENIRTHKNVKLLMVTKENRDDMPAEIIRWLSV